jgi:hypothetical protein
MKLGAPFSPALARIFGEKGAFGRQRAPVSLATGAVPPSADGGGRNIDRNGRLDLIVCGAAP